MPNITKTDIVCKDWEWVEFGDWNHIATNKDWEWVEFGDWTMGEILHPPTNNHTDK